MGPLTCVSGFSHIRFRLKKNKRVKLTLMVQHYNDQQLQKHLQQEAEIPSHQLNALRIWRIYLISVG